MCILPHRAMRVSHRWRGQSVQFLAVHRPEPVSMGCIIRHQHGLHVLLCNVIQSGSVKVECVFRHQYGQHVPTCEEIQPGSVIMGRVSCDQDAIHALRYRCIQPEPSILECICRQKYDLDVSCSLFLPPDTLRRRLGELKSNKNLYVHRQHRKHIIDSVLQNHQRQNYYFINLNQHCYYKHR